MPSPKRKSPPKRSYPRYRRVSKGSRKVRQAPKRSAKKSPRKQSRRPQKVQKEIKHSPWRNSDVFSDPIPDQRGFPYKKTRKLASLQKELKVLMAGLNKVCRRLGLTYCLDSGTLLGAVRHGDIIPWDDDIDVQMTREDIKYMFDNVETINEMGFQVRFEDSIHRFCKYQPSGKYNLKKDPYIDVFQVKEDGNKIVYAHARNRERWPRYYFLAKEKYPLKIYQFGRLKVLGPNNPYPYLKRSYGKNWNKGIVWDTHHEV